MISNEDLLYQMERELAPFRPLLAQTADTVLSEDVSLYPIFIVHQHIVDMGLLLLDRQNGQGNWSINISTLEEFVTKQIVEVERLEDFKNLYKSKDAYKHLCLFVLSENGATFVFLPRK